MPDESVEEPKRARAVAKPVPRRRDGDEDDYDYDDAEDDRPRRRRRDDDDFEIDTTGGLIPYKNPKALMAYYVGIFCFFLPLIGGPLAIFFGIQGLKYAKKQPKARGQAHATIGIVAGIFVTGIHMLFGLGLAVALFSKK